MTWYLVTFQKINTKETQTEQFKCKKTRDDLAKILRDSGKYIAIVDQIKL